MANTYDFGVDMVIPAHNEEFNIVGAVRRLTTGATEPVGLCVVANNCSDRTAELARQAGAGCDIQVIEVPGGGKAHALNVGDAVCTSYPRVYLDADVQLERRGLATLATALAEADAWLAVPEVVVLDGESSWPVRQYLAAWRALPAVRRGTTGRGIYMLSERGHAAVFPMPAGLVADDGYVERRIPSERRLTVPDVVAKLRAPRDLASLVRRRRRVGAGNRQLARLGVPAAHRESDLRTLLGEIRAGRLGAPPAVVFAAVTVLVRALELGRRVLGRDLSWGSDLSSRR